MIELRPGVVTEGDSPTQSPEYHLKEVLVHLRKGDRSIYIV